MLHRELGNGIKPLYFNINDGIELEATYFNNTDEIVEWGLLSTDEMMIAFGLYFEGEQLNYDINDVLPHKLLLHSNFPNPFNPITTLHYDLPEDGLVNITIYDMMGRIVKTLVNSSQTAGYRTMNGMRRIMPVSQYQQDCICIPYK
tara:strand:- start:15 stop:452 length:438 start_codon:yes stop_codon:yes gene_type:complete